MAFARTTRRSHRGLRLRLVRHRIGKPMRLLWIISLAAISMFAVTTATVVSAVSTPAQAGAVSIGNTACGKLSAKPNNLLTGGELVKYHIHWLGGPSNSSCPTTTADCPVFFGSCNAGYWVVGVYCSTLAATDLANAQSYCDLNNIVVLTDYNRGPNTASDYHHTSYNQCTTVRTLGSIFGGLPGTLQCVADNSAGDGFTEKWPNSSWGTFTGPVEETGSSTPFTPSDSSIDCPPSAANIAAGAIPNMCAFVVFPINFDYTCGFDICTPLGGGETENTNDYLATTLLYSPAKRT